MDKEQTRVLLNRFLNSKKNHSEFDIISFFGIIRTLIEFYNKKSEYQLLSMYSNWVLHTELSYDTDSKKKLFNTISNALNNHWGDNEKIISEVSSGIGLKQLLIEIDLFIKYIFNDNSKNIGIISKDFLQIMLFVIINRPVVNKRKNENKGKNIGMLNLEAENGQNVIISKIEIVEGSNKIAVVDIYVDPKPPKHKEGDPFLKCTINDF